MNFAILASKKDPAALNISSKLEMLGIKVNYIGQESIYSENIDRDFKEDFLIFVSKHKSEKNIKTLTLHAPGNWHNADFGGKPGKVCKTSAFFLKHIFQILNEKAKASDLGYNISLEVTHHGPYLEKPCCFIEIGSTEKEWKDEKVGRVVANTVKEAITTFNEKSKNFIPALGIGGPHYCPNFNKVQLNSDYALSHIIPEYALPLTDEMLIEALSKTTEQVNTVILDWKGLGNSEERKKLITLLEKYDLKPIRTEKIKD